MTYYKINAICHDPHTLQQLGKLRNSLSLFRQQVKISYPFCISSSAHQTLVLEGGSLVAAAYENIFTCTLTDHSANQVLCRLQISVDLLLPAGQKGLKPGKRRISIDPGKITFLRNDAGKKEADILQGRMVQFMEEGDLVRMIVNVGVLLTLLQDLQRYHELCPMIGDRVFLQLQPGAVTIRVFQSFQNYPVCNILIL